MRIAIFLSIALLAACKTPSTYLPTFVPHKIDIRQGNLVTQDMRARIKPGMNEAQVKAALGAPLLVDPYHPNRWDYVYRLEQSGKVKENQRLTLYFDNGVLVRAEEDGKPLQMANLATPALATASTAAKEESLQPATVPTINPDDSSYGRVGPLPTDKEEARPDRSRTADSAEMKGDENTTLRETLAQEIIGSVQAWAAAWAAKDTEAYLASYASTFKPQNMSRVAWKKLRSARLNKPQFIDITLRDIQVFERDETHATVTFKQDYRSDRYRDSVNKTLQLEKFGNDWKIVAEKVDY